MRPSIRPAGYLLAFLICTLALTGCKEEAKKKAESNLPMQAVHVIKVQDEKTTSSMEIMGTVQSADNAVIAARISGHITKLPVALGSKVNKGDLLVKINAAEISAQLVHATAQLSQTNRNLEREKKLLKKGASTPETVKSLEDAQRIAKASVKEVQSMLNYATITAPFSGIITGKSANIGDLAAPGKPLLDLEDESTLQVVANIPEAMILKIHVGDDIPVSIPSAGITTTGKVQEVSPAADPLSRTTPIKLSLPLNSNLRSGQFARLSLPERTINAIFVPQSAILPFGQMERIFIVSGDKARLCLVRSGAKKGSRIEILAGIDPGDQVIVAGNKDLVDGQPVTVNQ